MPSMDSTFHSQAPLVMPAAPVFSAPLYDSGPMYRAAALPPPPPPPNPPPKWNQANRQSWKRGGFKSKINTNNSKRNIRVPSTKVNMKRLRQQNAKGARKHFQGKAISPRSVPPAPYNDNMFLCHQAARREGHQRRNRGQQQQQKHHQYAREQTPSTILASPTTVSDRLSIKPDEAAWTAGGQALTKEQVALANSFNPLESSMQLKDFDSDTDEDNSSTGGSEGDEDQALVPGSKAYLQLPSAVRRKLQELEGEVEALHDENALLKERLALQEAGEIAVEGAGEVSDMSAEES